MNESELAASSTLSKKERTAVSKSVKEIIVLCFTYDLDLRYMMKDRRPGFRGILSEKQDDVLADPPNNV